jgi:hypothetical protein
MTLKYEIYLLNFQISWFIPNLFLKSILIPGQKYLIYLLFYFQE